MERLLGRPAYFIVLTELVNGFLRMKAGSKVNKGRISLDKNVIVVSNGV